MERAKVLVNKIRALYFIAGVLAHQERDPKCVSCKSRKEVAEEIKEEYEEIKGILEDEGISSDLFKNLFEQVGFILTSLKLPERPIPQRKEGGCHFPDKECLIKECLDIFEDLVEEEED